MAARYTDADRKAIVAAAEEAVDAIAEAKYSDTKGRAVARWQSVLGTSFKG